MRLSKYEDQKPALARRSSTFAPLLKLRPPVSAVLIKRFQSKFSFNEQAEPITAQCSTKMQTCIEWKYFSSLKVSTISLLAVISLRFKELLMWGFESGGWVIPLGYPQATPTLPLLSMGRGEGWKFQTLGMSCIAAVERLYWKEEQCALKWIHKRGNW